MLSRMCTEVDEWWFIFPPSARQRRRNQAKRRQQRGKHRRFSSLDRMLSVTTCAALTFIALTPPAAVAPVRASASSMLFGTLTSRKPLLDEPEAEYDEAPTPVFGRVRGALGRLYPRRVVSSVLTRIGLRRWLKSAAITDAMLTAELHGA